MPRVEHVPGKPNRFKVVSTTVYCSNCRMWVPTDTVEFLNLEEGDHGQDRMTFACGNCGIRDTSDVRRS